MMRNILGAALIAVACLSLPACVSTARVPTLAIRGVSVADIADGTLAPDQTVLIAGDRIVVVGPATQVEIPAGGQVVDAAGRYLIPGLIDMHVHALWEATVPRAFLPLFVANGVTTVRDMGGTLGLLRSTRAALAEGALLGPRLVAAGAILDGPEPVHPEISIAVSTPDEARTAVAELAAAGADLVKVYTLLPAEAFYAAVEAAAEYGLPIAGHVPAEVGPVAAAEAGMRTFEHLMSELDGFCSAENPAACAAAIGALRVHDIGQVATLVIQGHTAAADLCADPRLRYLPSAVLSYWFGPDLRPPDCGAAAETAAYEPRLPPEAWIIPLLARKGVPVLAGTDAGVTYSIPGWSLHDELRLLVEAGLSPAAALAAATVDAARFLGRDTELGQVRAGYLADLVLLDADPLEAIEHTQRISAVIVNGELIDRAGLDQVLERVAESARDTASE